MPVCLLAMLSITCSFGGLMPGTAPASGKLTDAIIAIVPGSSVDANGGVVDGKFTFAPADPQVAVAVQVGDLSGSAPMTVTWYQVTDEGEQELFTHTVQVSALDLAYSIGKNPGTLAEGDYKIVAALNGQTQQILLSVAQPSPGQVQSQGQAATSGTTPTGQGQPPVDGGSGKTASPASSNLPPSSGNSPASSVCEVFLSNLSGDEQSTFAPNVTVWVRNICPDGSELTATVDGPPHIVGAFTGNEENRFWVDPCSLSGGKDLPGTRVRLDAGPHTFGVTSATWGLARAGPFVITLGPDKSPPHLPDPKPNIKIGTRVHKGQNISWTVRAEEAQSGESWQEGVQDIQVTANGTVIASKDYLGERGKWCAAKSWKQALPVTYPVTAASKPLITLCAVTHDFAGNWRKHCGDYPAGDHWTGTIRSTTSTDFGHGATCSNEKWLFKFDAYVAADGTIAGRGTGQPTSQPQCNLGLAPGYVSAHNAAFDVSGKLDGKRFRLFFTLTSLDGGTAGQINYSLLAGASNAEMPPFAFSITGAGSAGGIVTIAYVPSDLHGTAVSAEHVVDMKCLDCNKP